MTDQLDLPVERLCVLCRSPISLTQDDQLCGQCRAGSRSDGSSLATFRNELLSVSRLQLLEQCGLAFRLKYIDRAPREPSGEPADFGILIHAALERLHAWAFQEEHRGRVSEAMVTDAWQREFKYAPSSVTSPRYYADGLDMLRRYFRRRPELDAQRIVGIEQEFRIAVGRFMVLGYVDLAERIGHDGVLLTDYKSGRKLFSSEEVETDLQASVYHIAARELYPWARRVEFRFEMLRDGVQIVAERDDDQLALAREYVEVLGERSESGLEDVFAPRLNPNCPYCEFRRLCPAYAEASRTRPELPDIDVGDLESVAREHKLVSSIAKVTYARQKELAAILRARAEELGPFEAAGVSYKVVPVTEKRYSAERVLAELERAGVDAAHAVREIMAVDRDALYRFLHSLESEAEPARRARLKMLRAEVESTVTERVKTSRLDAREVRRRGSRLGRHSARRP